MWKFAAFPCLIWLQTECVRTQTAVRHLKTLFFWLCISNLWLLILWTLFKIYSMFLLCTLYLFKNQNCIRTVNLRDKKWPYWPLWVFLHPFTWTNYLFSLNLKRSVLLCEVTYRSSVFIGVLEINKREYCWFFYLKNGCRGQKRCQACLQNGQISIQSFSSVPCESLPALIVRVDILHNQYTQLIWREQKKMERMTRRMERHNNDTQRWSEKSENKESEMCRDSEKERLFLQQGCYRLFLLHRRP